MEDILMVAQYDQELVFIRLPPRKTVQNPGLWPRTRHTRPGAFPPVILCKIQVPYPVHEKKVCGGLQAFWLRPSFSVCVALPQSYQLVHTLQ